MKQPLIARGQCEFSRPDLTGSGKFHKAMFKHDLDFVKIHVENVEEKICKTIVGPNVW